jgi:hypothetical protein
MDDDYISIGPGDECTVENDIDGYPAIRIQNRVWVEPPRWLLFGAADHDRDLHIDRLISALEQLRETQPQRGADSEA